MPQREVMLPRLRMEGRFEPSTLDAEARTVEIRWYTGATVRRFSVFDGPFNLSFSMDPKAVRMDRMTSGRTTLTAGHADYNDLSKVIGVFESAWLASDGGRGLVRFSKKPEAEVLFNEVRDRILTNVSMDAAIHQLQEVTKKGERIPHFEATDWEPMAVALVIAGADSMAQALSEDVERFPCFLSSAEATAEAPNRAAAPIKKEAIMAHDEQLDDVVGSEELAAETRVPENKKTPANPVTAAREVDDAIERDQQLAGQVQRAAEHYGLDDIWAQKHINLGTPIKSVLKLAAEERAKRTPENRNDIGFGTERDSIQWRSEQMAESIAARATGRPIPDAAKQFANFGFVDIGYELLKANRMDYGVDPRNRAEVIRLALTTSDFPSLLANSGNKVLMPAYDAAMASYRVLCIRQDLADFKATSILNTGDFPAPLQVAESGEIKLGYFGEQKNTVALGTYGRRLMFSRASLINDDLNSFGRVMGAYGQRIADFENGAFFTLLSTVGPTLGDGGAMFNATAVTTAGGHANYTSSGTAISDTSISVGAAMMAVQTGIGSSGLGDGIKLNILPKYLLASHAKRNLAFQYTSSNYVPAAPTSMNPWAGALTPVLDANLSGNRWWLFADPNLFPNFAYGSLAGAPGPRVSTRPGFEVEGVEMRVAFDFYVGGIDWRGGYCNAGA